MQPDPGLLATFKCLFGLIQVCESCQVKGCVFKAGSKVENLSIHSQKMRTFSMISFTFLCSQTLLRAQQIQDRPKPWERRQAYQPIPLFYFLALVSFLALPKPVFLCSESKRKRLLRKLFQMFLCARKFSAGTTRPKKPCFILIYFPTGLSRTFL